MTPKEKANKLIKQVSSSLNVIDSEELMNLTAKYLAIQTAKEVICEHKLFMHQEEARIKFWEDVESELQSI